MTSSIRRPQHITNRASDREKDDFTARARQAMNAFTTQRRRIKTLGTSTFTSLWLSAPYLPNVTISAIAEVIGADGAGGYLNARIRQTWRTDAASTITAPGPAQVDYLQGSGGVFDLQFVASGGKALCLQVKDNGVNPTQWLGVVQLLELPLT